MMPIKSPRFLIAAAMAALILVCPRVRADSFTHTFPAGWSLFGFPFQTESASANFAGASFALFSLADSEEIAYEIANNPLSARTGQGYWLWTDGALPLTVNAPANGELSYSFSMSRELNLFSLPYDGIVCWNDDSISIDQAKLSEAGGTFSGPWEYDGAAGYSLASELRPWRAYWIKMEKAAELKAAFNGVVCAQDSDCPGDDNFCKSACTAAASCTRCEANQAWDSESETCVTPDCSSHDDCAGADSYCRNPGLASAECVICDPNDIWDETAQACAPMPCNGSPLLCDKRFNETAFPTTHNAMTNREEGWGLPSQQYGLVSQLEAGIRGFMLDLHYYEGQVYMCHEQCSIQLNYESLESGLQKFKTFMEAHPYEVITLILENYVNSPDIKAVFETMGMDALAYAHAQGEPWPTLREMIDSGKKLVVLSDGDTGAAPWHMYVWSYAWDTQWNIHNKSEYTCDVNRGSGNNALFILNNFIMGTFGPNRNQAEEVNSNPFLIDRLNQCRTETGQMPNFPTVNFYDLGNLFEAVDQINGVAE